MNIHVWTWFFAPDNFMLFANCPFLDLEVLYSHSCPEHLLVELLQCTLHGATLKEYLGTTTDTECSDADSFWGPYMSLLLWELHWLPVCFCVQFKVLVITIKIIYGMGSGYMRNHLGLVGLSHPTHSSRNWLLQILSVKEFQLVGSRRDFLAVATAPQIFSFQNSLKTWLSHLAWGYNRACYILTPHLSPWFLTFNFSIFLNFKHFSSF